MYTINKYPTSILNFNIIVNKYDTSITIRTHIATQYVT